MSWEQAWREGRTGWDAGASAPALVELVERGVLPDGRALVPGCGAGYDVFTLTSKKRRGIGIDIAPTARARFEAVRDELRGVAGRARLITGDFFAFEDEPFDVIFDYTFLCALDPSVRPQWAKKMDALLRPDGELVTLVFPVVDAPPLGQGPPFPVQPDDVRALLEPLGFEAIELAPVTRSHPGREGMEHLGRWRRRRSRGGV
ncbi:MAG: methyltransferase domain-containing protein [Sandaracinaceae bacterium]|nr:methyltransferase domain-containing protein [Sandaracinaceae bacterium]